MDDALEEVHEELLAWAENEGVEMDSIRPMRISGRGFGIVATDDIPLDTEVLTVPTTALRTKDTVPRPLAKALPQDLTIHGFLAADLALNHQANLHQYAAWNAVVPSWEDIQLTMPLTWPSSLTSHFPPAAKSLLEKQRTKFERDWDLVSGEFPLKLSPTTGTTTTKKTKEKGTKGEEPPPPPTPARGMNSTLCSKEAYLYAWLLVNTRTFYFVTPKTEKLPKEDHMALQPVADLFNHTDKGGCHVTFDYDGSFSFRTTRPYEKGEEVHISYGSHSNDFLLVEYGFVLPGGTNTWDEVRLDEALLPGLTRGQKDVLEECGFLGNYVLDRETVCHRTQVAARLFLTGGGGGNALYGRALSMEDWRRFVNGLDDGERSQQRVDEIIIALLKDYLRVVAKEVKAIKDIDFADDEEAEEDLDEKKSTSMTMLAMNESRRELLLRRWSQIEDLVSDTMKRLQ